MMMKRSTKIALVTGASRGLGRNIAVALARDVHAGDPVAAPTTRLLVATDAFAQADAGLRGLLAHLRPLGT